MLVTQNVDDLHARAGLPKEKMVQIHGDIFLTRCSRCDFGFTDCKHDHDHPPSVAAATYGVAGEQEQEHEEEEENVVPRCAKCDALMRPGVVWFGEQLPWTEMQRVESYLGGGVCDLVIVAGTTATFGYIVDWALRASPERFRGELIEVNPEETPLSRFATRLVREPAAMALPHIVNELAN
jgi:NAD-dependent deacetylase